MLRVLTGFAAMVLLVGSAGRAHGSEPPSAPTPSAETAGQERSWYGWQTLAVDAVAAGVGFGSIGLSGDGEGSPPDVYGGPAGLTIYGLGPPLVHVLHHRWDMALIDLGIRVGAPLLLGAVGWGLDAAANHGCGYDNICYPGLGGAMVGSFLGYTAAVTVDAAVLAYDKVLPERAAAAHNELSFWPSMAT